MTTKETILVALFVALITVGAFIKIPIPVCPFTLQLLFTTLAGLFLGAKLGFLSVFVYIVIGLIGMPIFTQGGGFSYIFQPTFGYLIGFAVGSYVIGFLAKRISNLSYKYLLTINFINLFIVYLCGMIYVYFINTYYLHTSINLWTLFLYCFILAVPGDIILCIIATILAKKILPILKFNKD